MPMPMPVMVIEIRQLLLALFEEDLYGRVFAAVWLCWCCGCCCCSDSSASRDGSRNSRISYVPESQGQRLHGIAKPLDQLSKEKPSY